MNCKTKNLFSIFFAVLLLVSIATPAYATSSSVISSTEKKINIDNYSFDIIETIDNYHRVTLTFSRDTLSTPYSIASRLTLEETKALLSALGFSEDVICHLSSETLSMYATSPVISATTSYIEVDKDNNVKYIDEATAIKKAAESEAAKSSNISTYGSTSNSNAYARITHTATAQGSGYYHFSSYAYWLSMPVVRACDSIGSCAQDIAIDSSSRSGWYSYTITNSNTSTGTSTTSKVNENISSSRFKNQTNGSFYGSAALVNLPNDSTNNGISVTNTNFACYYEFTGSVRNPGLTTRFNSVGTYSHSNTVNGTSPSLTLTLGGAVSGSIALSGSSKTDLSAELLVEYTA